MASAELGANALPQLNTMTKAPGLLEESNSQVVVDKPNHVEFLQIVTPSSQMAAQNNPGIIHALAQS